MQILKITIILGILRIPKRSLNINNIRVIKLLANENALWMSFQRKLESRKNLEKTGFLPAQE